MSLNFFLAANFFHVDWSVAYKKELVALLPSTMEHRKVVSSELKNYVFHFIYGS